MWFFFFFRVFEQISSKIGAVFKEDQLLASLNQTPNSSVIYRIEEIPVDELDLSEDEMLVPVAHFQKDCFGNTFGTPFFVKVKDVRIFFYDFYFSKIFFFRENLIQI